MLHVHRIMLNLRYRSACLYAQTIQFCFLPTLSRSACECLVLVAYAQTPPLNAQADVSRGARGLNFGLSFHLNSYFVYASSEALASLRIRADSPESSLLDNAIDFKISCADPHQSACNCRDHTLFAFYQTMRFSIGSAHITIF